MADEGQRGPTYGLKGQNAFCWWAFTLFEGQNSKTTVRQNMTELSRERGYKVMIRSDIEIEDIFILSQLHLQY